MDTAPTTTAAAGARAYLELELPGFLAADDAAAGGTGS